MQSINFHPIKWYIKTNDYLFKFSTLFSNVIASIPFAGLFPPSENQFPPNENQFPPNENQFPPNENQFPPNEN